MKSCRRCKEYDNKLKFCTLHKIQIEDVLNATYCKRYRANVKTKEKVKCVNCKNINKYNYCFSKKRCFNFEERIKERQCINFIKK
jgi:hypothetical protein